MQTRFLVPIVSLALLAPVAAGCGSDTGSSSGSSGATTATYAIVTDADVAAGIAKSKADMAKLSAEAKPAEGDIDALFEDWEGYEGTVKKNDKDTYLALEDALGAFKKAAQDGDADAMSKAATDFGTSADAYLAKHPA